tara:strand:+ start:9415 stop:10179 length:765 start_codon:yes stop_codon:yes gene_type:complete
MKKILLIGSGNLATHLALKIDKKKYLITQVFSRNIDNAKNLANKIQSDWTIDPKKIKKADITLVAISDDSIKNIINILPKNPTIHTSGSTSIDIFKEHFLDYGVLYPLQTFNKDLEIEMKDIPFFIESNNKKFEKEIYELALSFSNNITQLNSFKRQQLHIAAVFACNFSNHMLVIAKELMEKENISYSLLLPLIKQSLSKIESGDPNKFQTGPAARNDNEIIEQHIKSINQDHIKELYKLISKNIIRKHDTSY